MGFMITKSHLSVRTKSHLVSSSKAPNSPACKKCSLMCCGEFQKQKELVRLLAFNDLDFKFQLQRTVDFVVTCNRMDFPRVVVLYLKPPRIFGIRPEESVGVGIRSFGRFHGAVTEDVRVPIAVANSVVLSNHRSQLFQSYKKERLIS